MSGKKTRAEVPKPKSAHNFIPGATKAAQAANNMRGEDLAPMTFNMPRGWHTEFKTTAVLNGMNMKDLLFECFEAWKREQELK